MASFVLRVPDRTAGRLAATATWLIAENTAPQYVEPGSVVAVTERSRPVAYFHVAEVAPSHCAAQMRAFAEADHNRPSRIR
jgi:hypothetical protein